MPGSTDTPPAAALLGQVISERYRVDAVDDASGPVIVYRAAHLYLRKEIVLKVLPKTARDHAEALRGLEREAIAGAHVRHSNVATATDFGTLPDGGYFLVLERIEGPRLADVLRDGAIPARRALELAGHVASAVAAIHAANITHGSVGPERIIVSDADGTAKLDGLSSADLGRLSPDVGPTPVTDESTLREEPDFAGLAAVLDALAAAIDDDRPSARATLVGTADRLREGSLRAEEAARRLQTAIRRVDAQSGDGDPSATPIAGTGMVPGVETVPSRSSRRRPWPLAAVAAASMLVGAWWLGRGSADDDHAPSTRLAGSSTAIPSDPAAQPPAPGAGATAAATEVAAAGSAASGPPDKGDAEIAGLDAKAWRDRLTECVIRKHWVKGATTLIALAQLDPQLLKNPEVRDPALTVAVAIGFEQNELADKVFDALSNRLGTDGLDFLYELVASRGGTRAATRAAEILAKPEVRARATPALRIAFDLRMARCEAKGSLIDRAAQDGDGRSLFQLQVLHGTPCESLRDACCYERHAGLVRAIKTLQAKARKTRPDGGR